MFHKLVITNKKTFPQLTYQCGKDLRIKKKTKTRSVTILSVLSTEREILHAINCRDICILELSLYYQWLSLTLGKRVVFVFSRHLQGMRCSVPQKQLTIPKK
jgi:hypothetical protein